MFAGSADQNEAVAAVLISSVSFLKGKSIHICSGTSVWHQGQKPLSSFRKKTDVLFMYHPFKNKQTTLITDFFFFFISVYM